MLGIQKAAGQTEEALQTCRGYMETAERLAAATPDEPGIDEILGSACHQLGAVLSQQLGWNEEAEESWRRAVTIREKLVAEFPETRRYRQQLAWSHEQLGGAINSEGRSDEAEKILRKAVELLEGLVEEAPEAKGDQVPFARCLHALGTALESSGRVEEAQESLERAIVLWKELAAADPTDTVSAKKLPEAQSALAELLKAVAAKEKGGPTDNERPAE